MQEPGTWANLLRWLKRNAGEIYGFKKIEFERLKNRDIHISTINEKPQAISVHKHRS